MTTIPEIGKLYYGVEGIGLKSGILMLVNIEHADRVIRELVVKKIEREGGSVYYHEDGLKEQTPQWISADRYLLTKTITGPNTLVRFTFLNLTTQVKESVAMECGPSFGYFFSEIEHDEQL